MPLFDYTRIFQLRSLVFASLALALGTTKGPLAAEDAATVPNPMPVPAPASIPAGAGAPAGDEFPGGFHHRKFFGASLLRQDGTGHLNFNGFAVGLDSQTDRFSPDGGFIQRSAWGFDLRHGELGDAKADTTSGATAQANLELGYDWTRIQRGWGVFLMGGGYGSFEGYGTASDKESEVTPGDSDEQGRWRSLHGGRYALQVDVGIRISALGELLISSHTERVAAARYHRNRAKVPDPDNPGETIERAISMNRAVGKGFESGLAVVWLLGNRDWNFGYTRISALALTTLSGEPEDGKESRLELAVDCWPMWPIGVRAFVRRISHTDLGIEAAAFYRSGSVTDTQFGIGAGFSW